MPNSAPEMPTEMAWAVSVLAWFQQAEANWLAIPVERMSYR